MIFFVSTEWNRVTCQKILLAEPISWLFWELNPPIQFVSSLARRHLLFHHHHHHHHLVLPPPSNHHRIPYFNTIKI